jgi:hypothetical protein
MGIGSVLVASIKGCKMQVHKGIKYTTRNLPRPLCEIRNCDKFREVEVKVAGMNDSMEMHVCADIKHIEQAVELIGKSLEKWEQRERKT